MQVDRCFGFDTAVEESQRALQAAKVEASSARNGIGLVKLMGRSSGFIACQASLASGVVDVCLIPEVPFELEGRHGMLTYLEKVSPMIHCADRTNVVLLYGDTCCAGVNLVGPLSAR